MADASFSQTGNAEATMLNIRHGLLRTRPLPQLLPFTQLFLFGCHGRRSYGESSHKLRQPCPPSSTTKLNYPDAPTAQHSDLASFIAYVRRTGLDEKSTVYIGTHYEYKVSQSLSKYGFFLKRIGGSSDYGTDLVGTWTLPSSPPSSAAAAVALRVLVQCKAGSQRVGPQHVRELEGAFVGAPAGWRGSGVLGVLVSERAATKGVRDSLGRSKWPMMFMCCSRDGTVSQMVWNQCAEELGLDGYAVGVRRGGDEEGLVLMRDGRMLLPLLREDG
ncbi:hypothetical protein QQS21_006156 [Conoideocrella luteorostrata]|uniref:Uncharacterized protein n=1 Tax=Conoideocrella luteorostrata TaxID=1105319 RepID=A0AAJ0G0D8_9HYPO|nr:hypothetical protein QQS21_006156 [Conoideocrella luteorostrata]